MQNCSRRHYSHFTQRLNQLYIIALLVIALLTVATSFLLQQEPKQHTDDAHIVNLAGRQGRLILVTP